LGLVEIEILRKVTDGITQKKMIQPATRRLKNRARSQ